MIEILQFVFSSFWIWLGTIILIGLPLKFIFKIYNYTLRHWNIHKHGYPQNCDADGDFLNNTNNDN